jgi:septum formation inhibitor-activating ATPase MinD
MLVTLWSPKGGSGTSVTAAAFASVLARHHRGTRLIDLAGDQPTICGIARPRGRGIGDWLAAGPTTPASAIESFTIDDVGAFSLVPTGAGETSAASGAAGAALAVVLRNDPRISVVDAGLATAPAARSLVELADLALVVMRSCIVAIHRLQARDALARVTAGAILVDDDYHVMRERDVSDVVRVPVLGVLPCTSDIAHTVDAGLLLRRAPDSLFRAITETVQRLGLGGGRPLRVA